MNASLNTFLSFFIHHWFTKVLKTPEKFLSLRCRHFNNPSLKLYLQIPRLDDLAPAYQEALHNKVVIDYNKRMKLNDFRHLCESVYSKEVSLLRFVKFVTLVLFRWWKKKMISKNIDPFVSIASSNNEKIVPPKKTNLDWMRGVFSCTNGHK